MKVLLVNQPMKHLISANVPGFVEEERGTYPPLGLLYIASYLREHGPKGLEVLVLDTVLESMSYEEIEEFIRRENPDVVATQALTFTVIDSLKIVEIAKKVNPEIVTVLGGRHCDIYPEETIGFGTVDYVITGEGEITFTRLINNLNSRSELERLPGLTFKTKQGIINNPPELIENLDELPFPARELTNYRKYHFLLAKKSMFTTLFTSRGCPYGCSFCDEGRQKYRALSALRVVEEIVECKKKLGVDTFFIFDSTFTVNRQRVVDFCDELVRRRMDIRFDIRSRINLIDDEILGKLKKAGCIRIQYGVESGNNRILRNIKKMIRVEEVERVVRKTRRYGFEILCDFMIGLPGEKEEEIMDTINFSLNLPIDYAQFAITVPYPNTELYHEGMRKGMHNDYWREFSMHPRLNFEPRVREEHLNREELVKYLSLAYSRFYKRPGYIWQQVLKMRTVGEFYRKMRAGVKLLMRT